MSDQKRASLTTLSSNKKDKKVKEARRTVRLKVNLSESNEKTCPEYNYVDLLNSVEKRRKKKLEIGLSIPSANGLGDLDPFAEDDEDKLKEIARSFEERYGPPLNKKKCKKREDYLDIGAGYDETDPFIDNTDAYDEIVPEEMTTAHGGFYINSGALEYKRVEHNSDISDGEEIKNTAKKKFKKILVSDEEEEEEEDDEEEEEEEDKDLKEKPEIERKDIKLKEVHEEVVAATKRKVVDRDPCVPTIKKRKKNVDGIIKKKSLTVKDLLKEKRETEKPETKATPVPSSVVSTPASVTQSPAPGNTNILENKTTPVVEPKKSPTTSITDVIESVISAACAQEDSSSSSSSSISKSHSGSSASSNEEDSQNNNEKDKLPQKEEVKLPENLPENLKSVIALLKNAAKTSAEGKCKFFSPEVNNLLFQVEQSSKSIGVVNRNIVYGHLASYVPCTKDTLMKRAKKLLIDFEEDKLKEPMRRLKAAIDKMMPAIIEKHTKDCQAVAEEKGLEDPPAAGATGDSKASVDGKKSKSGIPLRVFPWNEEVRSLLCEVVKIKLQSFELSKPRKESAKEYLKGFLESEVRGLWPAGWMKTIILYRESRSVHCNTMTKPGKPNTGPKKAVNKQPVNSLNSPVQKTAVPAASKTSPTVSNSQPKASSPVINTSPKVVTVSSNATTKPGNPSAVSAVNVSSSKAAIHTNGSITKSNMTSAANLPSALQTPISSASPNSSASSLPPSVPSSLASNVSPSVTIIKCSTSQTITNTPSQKLSSSLSRPTTPSVSTPHISTPTHVSSSGGGKSKALNSGSFNESDSTKVPSRTKSSNDGNRESVVTKNPVLLPQVNLPDCISVTPANSMQTPSNKSPSTPIMSLKQRILQDAAAVSGSKQSSENTNGGGSAGKLLTSGADNCEVLLVGDGKKEGKLNLSGLRQSGIHNPKSHPLSMGHKVDVPSSVKTEKDAVAKENPVSFVPRLSPPKEDKFSEGKIVDETVTATDVLSQIINSSLGGFPNSSNPGKGGINLDSLSHRHEHLGDQHLGMFNRIVSHAEVENKEKLKDIVGVAQTKCSLNSRVDNPNAAVADTEESVQLEVDRVMKELLELREMTEDSMESETDKHSGPPYRSNDKAQSALSSSVSVIAVNSASSKHHTANSQTQKINSAGQVSSSAMNSSSQSPSAASQLKRSSSVSYSSGVNPIPSTKSYGFQDEFQRHLLQDCGKSVIDSDGAVYMGNKVHKEGERSRTASYNSLYQNTPLASPAALDRSRGLQNSVDGANDHHSVLMSLSQFKNLGEQHKHNNPPNAHQHTRHSLPTHNSFKMESCPNINFSGNGIKPRISSQQFSAPELLTQVLPHIPQNIK
ncbi:ubinuclein-1 isoform X2 [Ischnura elegans]|uniref:ubinuclein-1 isoform X2 n=1 Tax=Ischnura elegans TaxID=197161 RepID=UPI001ED8A5B6|nr:ubinuclein-1 isoform X2 [Ischnura elegans]